MIARIKIFFLSFVFVASFLTVIFSMCSIAEAKSNLRMVTTTTVLSDIAREITGDDFQIDYVASPNRDLHKVSLTPNDVLKTKKADIFIHHGLAAEPWLQPLLNAAGNAAFLGDSGKIIDTSRGVIVLEIPDHISRIDGDIHPGGNPHYWLDPENAIKMAHTIANDLGKLYPDKASKYQKNADEFSRHLQEKLKEWRQTLAPFKNEALVTYHRSWSYFANQFGFEIVGEIEPKPGIPVTAKHLQKVIQIVKDKKVHVIIKEPYFNDRAARKIAAETGTQVVEFYQVTQTKKELDNYSEFMEFNVEELKKAFLNFEEK
jgi:zinc/manganese transport system substrate-binding protein